MKSLYYRSEKVSPRGLLVIGAITLLVLFMMRLFPYRTTAWEHHRMLEAAYRTQSSFDVIQCYRTERGQRMLKSQDPSRTGMLGPSMSLVTTLPGHLDAKQTSVNPNFAAVAVRLLLDAGVQPGDSVAIGMTGSFPALNIAVLQACESLDLRPLIVSSAASSQFGANDPGMMWPDMEKILSDQGLISHRSLLTSTGGFRDAADGMTDDTRKLLLHAIRRNNARFLRCNSLTESIEKRLRTMETSAESEPIAAYINIGGGAASVGGTEGNKRFGSGIVDPDTLDDLLEDLDCVAMRFMARGVPFINMVHTVGLAKRYGLVIAPIERPAVGQSGVYSHSAPKRWLALLGIAMILATTWLVIKPPVQLTKRLRKSRWWPYQVEQPQWMV